MTIFILSTGSVCSAALVKLIGLWIDIVAIK